MVSPSRSSKAHGHCWFSTAPAVVIAHITGTPVLGRSYSKTNPVQMLNGDRLMCNAWCIIVSYHLLWQQRRALWIYPGCRNTLMGSIILRAHILLRSWIFWKHSHSHAICFLSTCLLKILLFLRSVTMTLSKVGYLSVKCILIYDVNFQCFKIVAARVSRQVLKQNLLTEFLAYSCGFCWFQFIHFFSNTMLNK